MRDVAYTVSYASAYQGHKSPVHYCTSHIKILGIKTESTKIMHLLVLFIKTISIKI